MLFEHVVFSKRSRTKNCDIRDEIMSQSLRPNIMERKVYRKYNTFCFSPNSGL